MSIRFTAPFLALVLLIAAPYVPLQIASTGTAQAEEVPLTGAEVEAVAQSYPDMVRLADKYQDHFRDVEKTAGVDPISAGVQRLDQAGVKPEFDAVARKYGFADINQWSDRSIRVIQAYLSLRMADAMEAIKQMIAQMEENPDLTDEQKAAFLQHFPKDQIASMQASDADKKVVAPYLTLIEERMESLSEFH